MRATGTRVRNYTKCRRSVYLDAFGPREEMHESSTSRDLKQKGIEFEDLVVRSLPTEKVRISGGSLNQRAQGTLEAMRAGVEWIVQGAIVSEEMSAIPDVLHRRDIPSDELSRGVRSRFGAYYYEPIDIKSGTKPKEEHWLQVTFYALVLEGMQGYLPENGHLWLRPPLDSTEPYAWEQIEVEEHLMGVRHVVRHVLAMDEGDCPEFFSVTSTCRSLCSWYEYCSREALAGHNLSLIKDLGERKHEQLREEGIHKWEDLADLLDCGITGLAERTRGLSINNLSRFRAQARVLLTGEPEVYEPFELPEGDPEVFFDLEETTQGLPPNVQWIFGQVVRWRGQAAAFEPVVVRDHSLEGEARGFREWVSTLESAPSAVVYHYGNFEKDRCRKLAARTLEDDQRIWFLEFLDERFVDLLKIYGKRVLLPTPSYSLKHTGPYVAGRAPHLGEVRWEDADVGPVASGTLWKKWVVEGDERTLARASAYNEVDCWATLVLKDFLTELPAS